MSSVRVGSYALLLNSHVTSHIKPILGWNCGGGGENLYNILPRAYRPQKAGEGMSLRTCIFTVYPS